MRSNRSGIAAGDPGAFESPMTMPALAVESPPAAIFGVEPGPTSKGKTKGRGKAKNKGKSTEDLPPPAPTIKTAIQEAKQVSRLQVMRGVFFSYC